MKTIEQKVAKTNLKLMSDYLKKDRVLLIEFCKWSTIDYDHPESIQDNVDRFLEYYRNKH